MEIITDLEKISDRSEEIDVKKDNEIMRKTIVNLKNLIREKNLTALSAPQIGVNYRLFVINFNGELVTFINPIIVKPTGLELSRETCSSIPGETYIRPRHPKIDVMYQTPLGKIESRTLLGLAARVFQHQLDHLEGLFLSDVGLKIDDDFDNATDDERKEIIDMYLESLDLKEKQVKTEIEQDEELKKISDAVEFASAVKSGKVDIQFTQKEITEEIKQKIEEEKANGKS